MNIIEKLHQRHPTTEDPAETKVSSAEGPCLSVADVARALRVSSSTVRRYIADHREHIEIIRDGRNSMVLLSSYPVLVRIRDLKRCKANRSDIDRLLGTPPGEEAYDSTDMIGPPNPTVEGALEDLRKELADLKQELRDNELVVRQSVSTILFLIEKHAKEVEFHASEERIANRERDLRLRLEESNVQTLRKNPLRRKGFLSTLASMILTPMSSR